MKRNATWFFILSISIIFISGCTVNNVIIDKGIGEVFSANKVEGTFGMFDNSRGKFTIYDLDRFKLPYSPGGTFNIFNSLLAMHIGRLSDERSFIKNIDTTISLNDAFRSSSTPHFMSLARIIGKDTMKRWIDSLKYGNMKIGASVDSFWMNDSLKISADEQLGIMKRMYFKQLPFRASVQESVKKMMIIENNAQLQLAYNIGQSVSNGKSVVWVIGWIEENRHVYPFVLNFSSNSQNSLDALAKKITEDILTHVGFFKGIM
jgi:beta-lactamase class D